MLADPCPRVRPAGGGARFGDGAGRAGENAGTPAAPQARPIAVRSRSAVTPWNTGRSAVRSSRGTSSVTAANSSGGTCTHRARPVLATVWETRHRCRGSSTSPHASASSSPTRIPVASSTSNGSLYRTTAYSVSECFVIRSTSPQGFRPPGEGERSDVCRGREGAYPPVHPMAFSCSLARPQAARRGAELPARIGREQLDAGWRRVEVSWPASVCLASVASDGD